MICDDCCETPCVCEKAAKWITERIRDGCGDVTFGVNENGHIVLGWWTNTGYQQEIGDTAEDAIARAEARES